MPVLFALVGATGIGKSNLSLELAERYNAEIIGVDSRQVYKGFRIGTAQPEASSLKRVRHHLVDFLSPMETFSAGEFCRQVKDLVKFNPDTNYILVGGTGLYIQSLILGLPKIPDIPDSIRLELEGVAAAGNVDSLYKMAQSVDPEAMAKVEVNNVHRIVRVLEVFKGTGRKLSEFQKEREGGIGALPVFWLQRNRESLYNRINARVDQMMDDGWLKECSELAKTVPLDAPAWLSLGYRELLQAKNPGDVASIVEDVKKKTRNYAKRQLTWFRWQLNSTPVDMENENPLKKIVDSL